MTVAEKKVLIQMCNEGIHLPLWRVRSLNANRKGILRLPAATQSAQNGDPSEPPFQVGDTFYIQEAWTNNPNSNEPAILYKTDYSYAQLNSPEMKNLYWQKPASMPRENARLFFRVDAVRLEKIKNAKAEDLLLEGAPACNAATDCYGSCQACRRPCAPASQYKKLWDKGIRENKEQLSYSANPMTWVISLDRL